MTSPAVREFEIVERGATRDLILNYFRYGLRSRTNPETGDLFTDDEIARATAPGTRWHIEAQGIDDFAQGEQRRALWLNDQLRINRACTQWLEEFHSPQWDPEGRLDATPGSGPVLVTGTNGTIVVASTTIPDETAYWGTTPAGVRVQVYESSEVIGHTTTGQTTVTMVAMDPGADTNLLASPATIITWGNRDPGMAPTATVTADWTGGTDIETDAEWASRMEGNQKHRPGSGNDAQQRAWARSASNSVEDAFIYPCAFGLNSFEVCVVQKRSGASGPLARIPSRTVLEAVTAQMVPPGSPVEPTPPCVIVVEPWIVYAHFGIRLSLLAGASAGWNDARPFPNRSGVVSSDVPYVSATGTSTLTIYSSFDATLPGQSSGATIYAPNIPRMMAWEEATSSWRELPPIASIQHAPPYNFLVTFQNTRPDWLVAQMVISPFTELHSAIAAAVVGYMDERGPNELFASDDTRYGRCSRFPALREEKPYAVGSDVANRVLEAIPGVASSADCPGQLSSTTAAPAVLSPQMQFLGRVGVYPLV